VYSLRRRLTLLLALGVAAVIAGAGLYLARNLGRHVTADYDQTLLTTAESLAALIEQEKGRIEFDYEPMEGFEREEQPDYYEVRLEDGTVLDRSTRLAAAGANLPRAGFAGPGRRFADATLPGGRPGRVVHLAFTPRPTQPEGEASAPAVVLAVARDRGHLDLLLARIRWTLVGFGGAAAALAVLLVWRVLATGLRPLDAIAAQVGQLDAHSLSARIHLPRTPRELAPTLAQLNSLLARLDASFERERRFTGNVAHELRTPIAELRSLAEVAARWPDDAAAVTRFFDDVRHIAGRMEHIVVDLLLLARCQAGVEGIERERVRLREIADATWSKLAPAAAARALELRLDLPTELEIESDRNKMEIILANLLDNAVSYSPAGSRIHCSAEANGAGFRLEVRNPASPLSDEDLGRLTEPFWRKAEARSTGGHAGLGLSLVAALAPILSLRFEVRQERDGTFRACLLGGSATA